MTHIIIEAALTEIIERVEYRQSFIGEYISEDDDKETRIKKSSMSAEMLALCEIPKDALVRKKSLEKTVAEIEHHILNAEGIITGNILLRCDKKIILNICLQCTKDRKEIVTHTGKKYPANMFTEIISKIINQLRPTQDTKTLLFKDILKNRPTSNNDTTSYDTNGTEILARPKNSCT